MNDPAEFIVTCIELVHKFNDSVHLLSAAERQRMDFSKFIMRKILIQVEVRVALPRKHDLLKKNVPPGA